MQRLKDEGGVVAIVMALVVCFVMLPLAALTVDIGMQRVLRRDMQSIADVVALDMSRQLDGSTQAVLKARASWRGNLVDSVQRNLGLALNDSGLHEVSAKQQQELAIATVTNSDLTVTVQMGNVDASGTWSGTIPYPDVPNAVKVTASSSIGHTFTGGSGGAERTAIATANNRFACFTVDSFAAQVNTGNSAVLGTLLTSLLGTGVSASVLSSSGIASANVDVLSFLNVLKGTLGVGSVEEVLSTNVSLLQVLNAEATVLTQSGTAAAAALNSQLIANIGKLPVNLPFKLGDLLSLTQGGTSALGATVNALDLALGSIFLANGSNAIGVNLATSPGVANLSAKLTVIQKPQITCGKEGAVATTPQVNLNVTGNLTGSNLLGGLIDTLNVVVGAVTCLTSVLTGHCQWIEASVGDFSLDLQVASATATLQAITCTGSNANGLALSTTASLLPVKLNLPLTIKYNDKNIYTGAVVTRTTTLTATVSTVPTNPSATTINFSLPSDYNKPKAGPSGNLSLQNLALGTVVTGDTTGLVGGLLGTLSSLTNNIQNTLIGPITSSVISPLLTLVTSKLQSLLGLDLAGSTVTAIPTATCGAPKLVG